MDKAAIFAALAGKPVEIVVPVIGKVYCRPLSVGGLVEYQKALEKSKDDYASVLQVLMIKLLCDESGNALFEKDDAELIAGIEYEKARQILEAILNATGLAADTEKNSEKMQS